MKYLPYWILVFALLQNLSPLFSQDVKNPENRIKYIDSLYEIAKKDLIGNGDLLNELILHSQNENYPKGELRGLISLGIYYTKNAMIDSASSVYEKGEKLIQQHPDLEFALAEIYANKAALLKNQKLHYQALTCYHKTHKINTKQKDKKAALFTKMEILNCHLALNEPDKVLAYSKELLQDTIVMKQEDLKYILYSSLAMAHFNKKEYGKAISWWNATLESIQDSDQKGEISFVMTSIANAYRSLGNYEIALKKGLEAKKILDNKPLLSAYAAKNAIVLGEIYNSLDNPDEAIVHFENAILLNPDDPIDIALSYKNLGAIFKRMESWDNAAKYYEKYGAHVDNLYHNRNENFSKIFEKRMQVIEETYKNDLHLKDNDILMYKNEKQKLHVISLLIGFFSLLLMLLSFILYKKYNTSEQQVELLKANEKKILENHLQSREEEFLATIISVNERLDKLSSIKKNLSSAIKYNNREEIIDVEKRLDQFISSISDLTILKDRIESQYPGITAQINTCFPDLSTNDVRHCLLMKLNLSIKESAQLLSVSTHAVKMARKRLKKKMNIPEEISLKDHLQNIST